jgi:hypothetical protein
LDDASSAQGRTGGGREQAEGEGEGEAAMKHIRISGEYIGTRTAALALCGHVVPLADIANITVRADCPECRKLNLEQLREKILRLGCGDSGCACKRPGGQTTNGGCRCERPQLLYASCVWKAYAIMFESEVRR